MNKIAHASGKRKKSIARATISEGKGIVKINNVSLSVLSPRLARLKIQEPLILAGNIASSINVTVTIKGGGIMSGADAARLAIAKALVEYTGDNNLKQKFLEYDRTLLVADVRQRETCKPNISRARAKRQKSYR